MQLKIGIIFVYILFTFFIPALGIPPQINFLLEYGNFSFFILFFFLFRKKLKLHWKEIDLKQFILIMVISLVVICIVSTTTSLLPAMEKNVITIEKVGIVPLIGAITITPFVEEIIFRYCFLPLNKNYWVTGILVLFSSILFSLLHGTSLSIFIMGLLLGILYIWRKNLWYPLLVHYINNIIAILLFLISPN